MSDAHSEQSAGAAGGSHAKYFFFVDGKKFDWPAPTLSGAEVRAAVPDLNPTFQLIVEGHGNDADRPVLDADTFSLSLPGRGLLKFYTAPPATFGGSISGMDSQ